MVEENEEECKGEVGAKVSVASSSNSPEVGCGSGGGQFVGGISAEPEHLKLTVDDAACKGEGEEGSSPGRGAPKFGARNSTRSSPVQNGSFWLTETTGLAVPPCKSDFQWVGVMMKRRGGFGKMAASSWKSRTFIVVNEGVLLEEISSHLYHVKLLYFSAKCDT